MRLDKFLKVSRLIKRRTVANEACDAGRVLVMTDRQKHPHRSRQEMYWKFSSEVNPSG